MSVFLRLLAEAVTVGVAKLLLRGFIRAIPLKSVGGGNQLNVSGK